MKKLRLLLMLIFTITFITILAIQFGVVSFENVNIIIADVVIAFNSDNSNAYFDRGKAYDSLGKHEKAIINYSNAINLDPHYQIAYINRGIAYARLKKYQSSLANFNKAINLNPDLERAYFVRGVTYELLHDSQNALSDYNKVISINKSHVAFSFRNKGKIYYDLKKYQKALNNFNLALKIDPGLTEVHLLRGSIHHLLEEYSKAILDYKIGLKKSNLTEDIVLSNVGLIEYELGRKQEAIKYWRKSLKINQNNTESTLAIAVSMYQQGEENEAIKLAIAALKSDKQWGNIQFLKGQLWGNYLIRDTQNLFKEAALKPLIY